MTRRVVDAARSLCDTFTALSGAVAGHWRRRIDMAADGAETARNGAESAKTLVGDAGHSSQPGDTAASRPYSADAFSPDAVAAYIDRAGWFTGPFTLRAHRTDAGTPIPPRTFAVSVATAPPSFDQRVFRSRAGLAELAGQNIRDGVPLDRLESRGPINPQYNCHAYTFSRDGSAGCLTGRLVDRILSDNGFRRVGDPAAAAAGDVVVYRRDGEVQHSGVVTHASAGEVYVDSKQGPLSLVRHRLDEVTDFYGSDVSVYRADRPDGRFLTPVENSEQPAPPWPPAQP